MSESESPLGQPENAASETATPPRLAFASAVSALPDTSAAVADAAARACAQLQNPADLAVVFVSHHHAANFGTLAAQIKDATGAKDLLGASGEWIVEGDREIEGAPALAIWLASLPGIRRYPMHLQFIQTPEGSSFVGWPEDLPDDFPAGAPLILLAEPFTFPADQLLRRLNEDQPNTPIVGGMASGARTPGGNRLFFGDSTFRDGAVALLLDGPVELKTVVSQGCRPIGDTMIVTKADKNVLLELGGHPALDRLAEIIDSLGPRERELIGRGLHIGIALSEYKDTFGPGDFLIRPVMSVDTTVKAIAVGEYVRPGQTIQFHVHDAQSADEELQTLLTSRFAANRPIGEALPQAPDHGALLFTCNGRGSRMFTTESHDAKAIRGHLGHIPLVGFFAQGEIGPVGGKNFLHGFTASLAVFGPRE